MRSDFLHAGLALALAGCAAPEERNVYGIVPSEDGGIVF